MKKTLTCIGCPMGCTLEATVENGAVTAVSGNTCQRGDAYARKECVAPVRTVTGTVCLAGGGVVSVRTAGEVPKDKVLEVARAFSRVVAERPVAIGDIVARDVAGTGVDVKATANA